MVDTQQVLDEHVAVFGQRTKAKFSTDSGEPEDHLRGPVEDLIRGFGEATVARRSVVLAGEDRVPGLHVKPDFAVLVDEVPVGFVEVKAPGKGADPDRFRGEHDKRQWERLSSLPNVLYTDGEQWGLYSYGQRQGDLARLDGPVETSGVALRPRGSGLATLLSRFLRWEPAPPRSAKDLALVSARLCRLLRAEVAELLHTDEGLQALARDWRSLLFPDADDDEFADGYAQTVTFALLLARVEEIALSHEDLGRVADKLADRHTLMGTALDVLTNQRVLDRLAGALTVLARVLAVVDWPTISRGDDDAWLLFYEDFLAEYDPTLKKATGSYYTPNPVVDAMTEMVDQLLRRRLGRHYGLAAGDVTVVDPAVGTGTFLFRIIERIAATIASEEGEAEIPAKLRQAVSRLIGFELQIGPFAVAEFRLSEELRRRGAEPDPGALRLYVADTLEDPHAQQGQIPAVYQPIAASRQAANRVKADEPVLVVIGNPPYKEHSFHAGSWVRQGRPDQGQEPILADFIPPTDWDVSEHVKHIYNPYVYFWRWASWKVFEHPTDHSAADRHGVVAFITVAGFLGGPGHSAMRSHLRSVADAIWVIDATPEGHHPPVPTRVFPGVQQPICITVAVRDGTTDADTPAPVHHTSVHGAQAEKFAALAALDLDDEQWQPCPSQWAAPFLPAASADWQQLPPLDTLLPWSGAGTKCGRSWVRAPSPDTLRRRWRDLIDAPASRKAELLDEHPTDRTVDTVLGVNLPDYPHIPRSIRAETRMCPDPVRIAFRSFDRQWLIPDQRVIDRPNPSLWWSRSDQQLYMTMLSRTAPRKGAAATIAALPPDHDHYRGSFGGRVHPLWRDPDGTSPNVTPGLLDHLSARLGRRVDAAELYAYVTAVLANPAYTERFTEDLATPGLRVPLTADEATFTEAVGSRPHGDLAAHVRPALRRPRSGSPPTATAARHLPTAPGRHRHPHRSRAPARTHRVPSRPPRAARRRRRHRSRRTRRLGLRGLRPTRHPPLVRLPQARPRRATLLSTRRHHPRRLGPRLDHRAARDHQRPHPARRPRSLPARPPRPHRRRAVAQRRRTHRDRHRRTRPRRCSATPQGSLQDAQGPQGRSARVRYARPRRRRRPTRLRTRCRSPTSRN